MIDLPEVGCQLSLRDLYEDAELQAEAIEVEATPSSIPNVGLLGKGQVSR